ncbi:MAG: hypothetical protein JXR84_00315 [Anaerolineae bacterium]|nr:hypothetical protein [Anaerolineae bacterium]
MNGIPGDLYGRVQTALLRCGPFDSDRALRPLFVDARLSAWRNFLPEAGSRVERVQAVVDALSERENPTGDNALVLLLRVLAENTPPGDACRGQLATLAGEVADALRADALRADVLHAGAASIVTPEHSLAAPLPAQTQGGITIIGDGNVVGNGNVVNVEKGTAPAAPAALSSVDVPALRARLQRFDAVEIESLCLDHFPVVYDKFARGLQRGEMINLLLDHCRRNPNDAARLTALLK